MKLSVTLRNSHPDGQPPEMSFVLAEGESCLIGRGSLAQVRSPSGTCSRKHCVLEVIGGELLLSDLNSAGGTFLNRERIVKRARVSAGASIHIGSVRIDVLAVDVLE